MLGTEAARYARWSAGVAMALVAITLGVYLQRGWVARRERKKAPPPAPPSVEKQSTALAFSKVEGNRTLFTVRASRSTEFKGRPEDLLEDVQITIFGRNGERRDTLHTQSCQYTKDGGRITCAGEVQMDLQSAAEAERAAQKPRGAARSLHVETRGVNFGRESGLAQTAEMVKFAFAGGEGQALGLEYRSDEGLVRLEKDVRLRLKRPVEGGARAVPIAGSEAVEVTGTSLEYRHERRVMRLSGPVRAASGTTTLAAGELALELDANYQAQRLVARPGTAGGQRPEVHTKRAGGGGQVSADELLARLDPGGSVTRVEGTGRVQGEFANGAAATILTANYVVLKVAARSGEPEELTAQGEVKAETRAPRTGAAGEMLRRLQSEAVRLKFAQRGAQGGTRLESAETLAPGALAWEETGAGGRATRLQAERLQLALQPNGQAGEAQARGNVQIQRMLPGRPEETSTAREGVARFDARGDWAEMELRGDVKLRAGERRGQAETAVLSRAAQTAQLIGNAVASDAGTRTTARTITFFQATGEIRAEGGVRSTDFAPRGVQLAPVPANLSADRLEANAQTGRALYSGHARLWQEETVMEAETIELLRTTRTLNARGNVRAVFSQGALTAKGPAGSRPPDSRKGAAPLWHMQSDTLSYREAESRARLEGNVFAQSAGQSLRAAALDVYFSRGANGGGQQVSRAVATGGVTVTQGVRRGTAERGEYSVAEGKFVLSGGNPTLYDAESGATTGRQLTFFLADDTIIVDSENGSRTLTKHRVEK